MATNRLIYEAFKARGFDAHQDVPASCAMGALDMARANCQWIAEGTEPPANANDIEWASARSAVDTYLQAYELAP